ANFNGILDPGEDGCNGSGIPWNGVPLPAPLPGSNPPPPPYYACNAFGNGKLDPGGTALASPGTVTTGDGTNGTTLGSANFSIIYPESEAAWVQVQLIATASVSGTESTANGTFVLPILES